MKTDKQRFFEALEEINTYRFVRDKGKRYLVREVAFEPEMYKVFRIRRYVDWIEFLESLCE